MIELVTAQAHATIDPGRGCDILSFGPTGKELLYSTPWRARADEIRGGARSGVTGSQAQWLEGYRGGWQTLLPNAGDPRDVDGAPLGYHGEASVVAWNVCEVSSTRVELGVALFTSPLRVTRTIELAADTLRIADRISNVGASTITADYAHHPALGADLLDGRVTVRSGARVFVNDWTAGVVGIPAGQSLPWPPTEEMDLTDVPESGRRAFGWLESFDSPWAEVRNATAGLGVRLEWDGRVMPYAWYWRELGTSAGWPWFGRGRVLAIEPSSTQASGTERRSALTLAAGEHVDVSISMTALTR